MLITFITANYEDAPLKINKEFTPKQMNDRAYLPLNCLSKVEFDLKKKSADILF